MSEAVVNDVLKTSELGSETLPGYFCCKLESIGYQYYFLN